MNGGGDGEERFSRGMVGTREVFEGGVCNSRRCDPTGRAMADLEALPFHTILASLFCRFTQIYPPVIKLERRRSPGDKSILKAYFITIVLGDSVYLIQSFSAIISDKIFPT
ncbi:hypothetical protein L1887_28721 [Cichorium endivia]|nr:hypothetical protein L1887_28721 [Cichorium endivia]